MAEPSFLGDAHFWVGCLSVVSGFGAFAARKGQRVHRMCGWVFVVTMTLLTTSGLWLSLSRDILFTVFLSLIALDAFVTGWAAAASRLHVCRLITKASPSFSALIAIGAVLGGVAAANTPTGLLNGLPAAAFYLAAAVSGVLCFLDMSYVIRAKPSETGRLTRHLWRMGFSFFLATGIFFFGNNDVLPSVLRHPLFLSVPVLAVVVWTLFYAVRVRRLDPLV